MPGRFLHIPSKCVDADGRSRPVFNPTIRRHKPPVGFSEQEWTMVTERLRPKEASNGRAAAAIFGIGTVFSLILGALFVNSHLPWYYGFLGFLPPVGIVLLQAVLRTFTVNTWGVVAFVEVRDEEVADAMLSIGRCPSCGHRLLPSDETGHDARERCTECCAAWNSVASSATGNLAIGSELH